MLPEDAIAIALRPELQLYSEQWRERLNEDSLSRFEQWLNQSPNNSNQLAHIWSASRWVAKTAIEQPEFFLDWLEQGSYSQPCNLDGGADRLQQLIDVSEETTAADFDRQLRIFRRQQMLRILWRDLCHLAEFEETAMDMTWLAEQSIQLAMMFHYRQLRTKHGEPIGKLSGEVQPMVILGMGKLGGRELNVSSDIDLIFTYPESGTTNGEKKPLSNQEFFIKLGQRIISSLDNTTADGFVFRVDMRLRPYGQSGSLVLNFDAMEEYYQTQGREWERYAMIKARVVSGDAMSGGALAGQRLMALLQPFTYRRYLDFSAIESMRAMKELINSEVRRKGIATDVKLGAGGIREIEFVVQVFQLIRGGRDSRLRERRVLVLLPLLEQLGFLPDGQAQLLADAYVFLRNVEHALQGYEDRQTQSLPIDDIGWQRLAWVMGFDGVESFNEQLSAHRAVVRDAFEAVIADSSDQDSKSMPEEDWSHIWPPMTGPVVSELEAQVLQPLLQERGFSDPVELAKAITDLANGRAVRCMQAEGRQRLDALMPKLLHQLLQRTDGTAVFQRVARLIEAVCRRTAYLTLLNENPNALSQLISLCAGSVWIAEELTHFPMLLDELLDPRSLYSLPQKEELRDELRQQTLRISWDDIEAQMDTLRYFRMAHGLRVAASEVSGALPLMHVSDYLTWLAEAIIEHVLTLAWQQMVSRHGQPSSGNGEAPEFIVVGYGKLGGIEMGHGSDLDLVFIHDAGSGYSDGKKSIDNQTFFTRLGQKMIHILNTQTLSGQLYEVDMRLRPSGNSGLLVSSLKAFERYQRDDAWTWEHQALCRARVVAGGTRLTREFEALRHNILRQPREQAPLRQEVIEMRQKMRSHLGSKGSETTKAGQFHLKQDSGGIVDIEFMVQYAVLAWAHKAPALTQWSDNIRILETLAQESLMSRDDVAQLIEAYKSFRSEGHRLALQQLPGVVSGTEMQSERKSVQKLWQRLFIDPPQQGAQ